MLLVVIEKHDHRYHERGFISFEDNNKKEKLLHSIEETYGKPIKEQKENYDFTSYVMASHRALELGYNLSCGAYKINNNVFIYIFDKAGTQI